MINWAGEILDTVFSLSGKWGRWLNVRKNRYCFMVWGICCIYWFGRDVHLHLYSQALFCIPSMCLHAYGFWHWNKKESKGRMYTQDEVNEIVEFERRLILSRWEPISKESDCE